MTKNHFLKCLKKNIIQNKNKADNSPKNSPKNSLISPLGDIGILFTTGEPNDSDATEREDDKLILF